ncbi:hypothetical protein BGZ73_005775 [Actinomortierella ambigua]|nr:hypothetical protein BGZ73_005775 [Actinomortierella ambigua]
MPPHDPPLTETEEELVEAYKTIIHNAFEDKYEDKWDDEAFDRAVDQFKARAQEIGFADPFELLSRYKVDSYETARAQLKKGPPACFRPGWVSPLVGAHLDVQEIVNRCDYVAGPRPRPIQRVVMLDFWASWCNPCVEAGPELSEMAEKYEGRVTILGINNESIFGETKPPERELLDRFMEQEKDNFRCTILQDREDGYAKHVAYTPGGYRAIPCVVLLVDGKVTFVGGPQDSFPEILENTVQALTANGHYPHEE